MSLKRASVKSAGRLPRLTVTLLPGWTANEYQRDWPEASSTSWLVRPDESSGKAVGQASFAALATAQGASRLVAGVVARAETYESSGTLAMPTLK